MHKFLVPAFALSTIFLTAGIAPAQIPSSGNPTACTNYYTPGIPILATYGAAYDVTQGSGQMEVQASCAQATPTLDIGRGNATDLVYHTAYLYQSNAWQHLALTSPNPLQYTTQNTTTGGNTDVGTTGGASGETSGIAGGTSGETSGIAGGTSGGTSGETAGCTSNCNANCASTGATITVCGGSSGVTTKYMGIQEGRSSFHPDLLQDLGVNFYRFNDLSRFMEPNDDTAYGALTPDAIKADVNVIPWSTWDAAGDAPNANLGNSAKQSLTQLENMGITPVAQISWRTSDNIPAWMPQDVTTTDNYNELWEHCFAMSYWLNVRNNFGMDIYQISNEPDYESFDMGQYFQFFHLCRDAVSYVYAKYLPGRTPRMTGPVSSNPWIWVDRMLQAIGNEVDYVDYHTYNWSGKGWLTEIRDERRSIDSLGYGATPLYISEFGLLSGGSSSPWDDAGTVASMQNAMLTMSMPGAAHVEAWSFYELTNNYRDSNDALVMDGRKTLMYYAIRELVRAMKGARPTYNSVSNNSDLTALTSFDANAGVYHLMVLNSSSNTDTVTVDLSALISDNRPSTTLYRYDSNNPDVQSAGPSVTNGRVSFEVAGFGSVDLVIPG